MIREKLAAFAAKETDDNLKACLEGFLASEMFFGVVPSEGAAVRIPLQDSDAGSCLLVFSSRPAAEAWWAKSPEVKIQGEKGAVIAQVGVDHEALVLLEPDAPELTFVMERPMLEPLAQGTIPEI